MSDLADFVLEALQGVCIAVLLGCIGAMVVTASRWIA